jgi:6-phosphogluconate dehydrogenase
MASSTIAQRYDLGMVGLGVMGRNLVLNLADHGVRVAGTDRDPAKVDVLEADASSRPGRPIAAVRTPEAFLDLLRVPRAVMMLVPAGPPVDGVIRDLAPRLQPGDVIVDGGNSHFDDTRRRAAALSGSGILYLGLGVSGGEAGARHGASLMPGGPREAYERVRPALEAAAARVDGDPCVAYLGPGAAGHYVKMVHNGIEYGLMRLIAETYDLMRRGLGFTDDELAGTYEQWNRMEPASYLVEITAHIFRQVDERTGRRLIDVILDEARQKGTGMWASQEAMELQVPTPTIDVAVAMRHLSMLKREREMAARGLGGAPHAIPDREGFASRLRNALYAGMIVTFAQGMALLRAASRAYAYDLDLETVARLWRGGCIIRSALLEKIRAACRDRPDLPNLLLDPALGGDVAARQEDFRAVACAAIQAGIPAPGLHVALAYFDGYRSDWQPANLVQAQRDYFGAHSYERVDAKGTFHTPWAAA